MGIANEINSSCDSKDIISSLGTFSAFCLGLLIGARK